MNRSSVVLASLLSSGIASAAVVDAPVLSPRLAGFVAPPSAGAAVLTPSPTSLSAPSLSIPSLSAGVLVPAAPKAASPSAPVAAAAAPALEAAPPAAAFVASSPSPEGVPAAAAPAAATFVPVSWDGAARVRRQLPYWKTAFEENARLLSAARAEAVPGLVSVSHFSTRDSEETPIPGLQLVLAPGADASAVLSRLAEARPELRDYRLLSVRTPGERSVLYLARPSRPAFSLDAKEIAARAAEELEQASFYDALNIASGNKDMATRVDRLLKEKIEVPAVFDSRREVLRYVVLGEYPAAARKADETAAAALADAFRSTGARRLWNGFWKDGAGETRTFAVALSPEAPADLARPETILGRKAELGAYNVNVKPVSAARRRWRTGLRWTGGLSMLALAGAVSFGGAPGLFFLVRAMAEQSPWMFINPVLWLGVPMLAVLLLKAGFDAAAWCVRMARLYFSVPR